MEQVYYGEVFSGVMEQVVSYKNKLISDGRMPKCQPKDSDVILPECLFNDVNQILAHRFLGLLVVHKEDIMDDLCGDLDVKHPEELLRLISRYEMLIREGKERITFSELPAFARFYLS